MIKKPYSVLILTGLIIALCGMAVYAAGWAEKMCPTGFTIVKQEANSVPMAKYSFFIATKPNALKPPFKSPEGAVINYSSQTIDNDAVVARKRQEMVQGCENEVKNPNHAAEEIEFRGKENLNGGAIYWFKKTWREKVWGTGTNTGLGSDFEEYTQVTYHAALIKKTGRTILAIDINNYLGDQKEIRGFFQKMSGK